MKNYFFVPGNKLHKLEGVTKLNVTILIDLEDALKHSERENIINELCKKSLIYKSYYIRVPVYSIDSKIDITYISKLVNIGFTKIMLPKLQSKTDFEYVVSKLNNNKLEMILLVESCRFFLELQKILLDYSNIIKAIALGSHDFISEVGGIHNLANLEYPRLHLLYLARMAGVEAIDIASMELKNEELLKQEILDGFQKGYDAKFYIHPWQLNVKEKINLYSSKELSWAKKVIEQLEKVKESKEFNPVIINGEIIERPHLNKAKKIIKYYETK